MKKLKLTLTVVAFIFVFATLLTSCGGGSKPSKSLILEDLRASFADDCSSWAEDMDIEKFEVELSESGEKEYTATLNVTAKSKSKYAELYWTAYVEYTKYDQGWKLEDCDWVYDDYKIIKYPSEKEISEIVKGIVGQDATVEKVEFLKNEGEIVCQVRNKVNWNKYVSGDIVSEMTLGYYTDDTWRQSGIDKHIENNFVLNTSLAGQYTIKGGKYVGAIGFYRYRKIGDCENGFIAIGNITETGLDSYCSSAGISYSSKLHFELDKVAVDYSERQITLDFKTQQNIVSNEGTTINPTLQITLNSRNIKNGDVEVLLTAAKVAYANTDD